MNTIIFVFLSFFFSFLQQPDQPVPTGETVLSEIRNATVYLRGAQVSRIAPVPLQTGANTIIFDKLSNSFSEQSIQISTDVPVTILSIRKTQATEVPDNPKLDSLETLKKDLESRIELKEAEKTILERELSILLSNQTLRGQNEKITAPEIKQAMDYFKEKLTEIETGRLRVNNTIKETQEELQEINRQITEIRQQARKQSGQIIAEIQSPRSQSVNFTLSYFIQNAGWYPSYDIRVDDIDQPLKLSYKANIYQSTGIDWNSINLSVSSAEPLASSNIPDFQPIYLGFVQPRPQTGFQDQGMPAARQKSRAEEIIATESLDMASAPRVSVSQNQTSFSFSIDTPYSVSGDGQAKTVGMTNHSLPAAYRYYAMPKARETAFLTARLTDWEDLNLLNGEANLYFEQTFVGQSQLQASAVGDTLQFSLGKDESITLERNRLREFSEKNFFGNRIRETRAWELVVKNTKNKSVNLTLIDQIPVSTNEDIEVDLQERDGADFNRNSGQLKWELSIDAGETMNRQFRYQVEYPSGKKIQQQ